MSEFADIQSHQRHEEQFVRHVTKLLDDDRLRIDTRLGRRPVTMFDRNMMQSDRGVELKRLMARLNRPDRDLESQLPAGKAIEVSLSRRRWWGGRTAMARLRAVCISPTEALIAGTTPQPASAADVSASLSQFPPPLPGAPMTVIVMSSSGFAADAREMADRRSDRTMVLVWPNDAGGWSTLGPPQTQAVTDLFDPENEREKRDRLAAAIESGRFELISSGISADKLANQTNLPLQWVESQLKSYAKESDGLAARRLNGHIVLFREGSGVTLANRVSGENGSVVSRANLLRGGLDMSFIERIKTLFSRKGDVEKKIALLSERRAALSQQREHAYDDMGVLEEKDSRLREQFAKSTGELPRRRITGQLLQIRKDSARRQQMVAVLNQQMNVISTHLHALELQQQGKAASLPDGEELAADAAKAEEVLAELEANSELAAGLGVETSGSLSSEEQALYDELIAGSGESTPAAKQSPQSERPVEVTVTPATKSPVSLERQHSRPEAG